MTYSTAIRECLDSHREHLDTDGVNALTKMARFPRHQHKAVVGRMTGYQQEVCLNAIGYAEQECAA